MAVAAPEIAEAAEGGMSADAASAVSAARAGHGRRLSPEVARELRKRASRKPKAAASSPKSSDGGGASSRRGSGGISLPSPGKVTAGRFVLAGVAFLLALELASFISGRYFTWSLGKGVSKLGSAAQAVDLYPGQSAKLSAQVKGVSSGAATAGVGTKAL